MSYPWDDPMLDDDDDFPPDIEPDDEPEEEDEKPDEKHDARGSMEDKLLKNRTILIYGEINMEVAMDITKRLLILDAESQDEIRIFINSPGGHVESGDTIFDMIRFVQSPVKVIGTGWVASAGALIYAAAERENRYSLPNTRFLLHQPAGGASGQAADIVIEAQAIIKMRRCLNEIFAQQTGQPIEQVEEDTDRTFWLSASQARDYGLDGHILTGSAGL